MNTFENETDRAKQIAKERPAYWQVLLAEELLRSNFSQIRDSYNNLSSGEAVTESRKMRSGDYIEWLKSKFSDLIALAQLFEVTAKEFRISSGGPDEIKDPSEVLQATEKIISLSRQLLDWEVDFKSIQPPKAFQRINELVQGTAIHIFDQIGRIPDELVKPIQQPDFKGGTFTTMLKVDAPPNIQEMLRELEQIANNPDALKD